MGRAPVCLALLIGLLACLPTGAVVKPKAARQQRKWRWSRSATDEAPSAGAHFFHKGEDALSWDHDDLTRVRELQQRRFDDKQNYQANATLAGYLGLQPLQSLHMPVPLNILFLGFAGDGNLQLSISEPELAAWFEALDHVLPHTRVALSEVTCAEDGHCAGQVEGSFPPDPLASHVHLNFSCQVVSVAGHHVLEAFERAVFAFSRPSDPAYGPHDVMGLYQVDALAMEDFVDGFLASLGLADTYTLLVVNPKWSASLPPYAYRVGFSSEEMAMLADQAAIITSLAGSSLRQPPEPPSGEAGVLGAFMGHARKFEVAQLGAQSLAWAAQAEAYLKQLEEYQARMTRALTGRVRAPATVGRALRLLQESHWKRAEHRDLGLLLGATLNLPPEHLRNQAWRASHPMEDCASPVWVGHERWLLIDLAARRADWGPALGGDGVVSHLTLPDVHAAFGELVSKRVEADMAAHGSEHSQQLQATLDGMKQQRLSQVHQHAATAGSLHVARGAEPGEEGSPQVDPDGRPVGVTVEAHAAHTAELLLAAELDVYERFGMTHCAGAVPQPTVCAQAQAAALDAKHQLAMMAAGTGNPHQAFRDHKWDIFGAHDPMVEQTGEVGALATKLKDRFLAELSGVLSRGLRHVIAPPSATWHHRGYLHDTATPYAHKVDFNIYLISDSSRHLRAAHHVPHTSPSRPLSFDVEAFQKQVARLQLKGQHFSFNVKRLNMLDEPALAVAFASSLRTTFVSVPHAHEDPIENEAQYVDSTELVWRMRSLYVDPSASRTAKRSAMDPHARLEVPVFVFLLDREAPILLDEHYNARAMEDMVLTVANAAHQDEHPTGFVCDGALLPRPMSPLKHALTAVLQHLGGVLPPHLGYSPHRHAVQHDWLWSVGAHPLSWTSSGTSYSQISIDALHRSYLLDALDVSIETVNAGVALLADEAPSEASWKVLQAGHRDVLRKALSQYSSLVHMWRNMLASAGRLDYGQATFILGNVEALSLSFLISCREVHEVLHPRRCAARSGLPAGVVQGILGGSAALALLALVLLMLPRLKPKAKAI